MHLRTPSRSRPGTPAHTHTPARTLQDVNKEPDAEQRFKDISAAYEVRACHVNFALTWWLFGQYALPGSLPSKAACLG